MEQGIGVIQGTPKARGAFSDGFDDGFETS
jgi:hypothetical protein